MEIIKHAYSDVKIFKSLLEDWSRNSGYASITYTDLFNVFLMSRMPIELSQRDRYHLIVFNELDLLIMQRWFVDTHNATNDSLFDIIDRIRGLPTTAAAQVASKSVPRKIILINPPMNMLTEQAQLLLFGPHLHVLYTYWDFSDDSLYKLRNAIREAQPMSPLVTESGTSDAATASAAAVGYSAKYKIPLKILIWSGCCDKNLQFIPADEMPQDSTQKNALPAETVKRGTMHCLPTNKMYVGQLPAAVVYRINRVTQQGKPKGLQKMKNQISYDNVEDFLKISTLVTPVYFDSSKLSNQLTMQWLLQCLKAFSVYVSNDLYNMLRELVSNRLNTFGQINVEWIIEGTSSLTTDSVAVIKTVNNSTAVGSTAWSNTGTVPINGVVITYTSAALKSDPTRKNCISCVRQRV